MKGLLLTFALESGFPGSTYMYTYALGPYSRVARTSVLSVEPSRAAQPSLLGSRRSCQTRLPRRVLQCMSSVGRETIPTFPHTACTLPHHPRSLTASHLYGIASASASAFAFVLVLVPHLLTTDIPSRLVTNIRLLSYLVRFHSRKCLRWTYHNLLLPTDIKKPAIVSD